MSLPEVTKWENSECQFCELGDKNLWNIARRPCTEKKMKTKQAGATSKKCVGEEKTSISNIVNEGLFYCSWERLTQKSPESEKVVRVEKLDVKP